jgi:hypothetical protein
MERRHTRAAQVAAKIRPALQAAYPGVIFAVKSRTYAGGDAVDVDWTDGPTTEAVDRLLYRYESGHFDAMQDCYIIDHDREQVTVHYVQTHRRFSQAVYAAQRAKTCHMFDIPESTNDDTDRLPDMIGGVWYLGQLVYHELHQIDMTAKPGPTQAQAAKETMKTDEQLRTGVMAIIQAEGAAMFKDGSRLRWADIEADEINTEDLEAASAILGKLTAEEKTS